MIEENLRRSKFDDVTSIDNAPDSSDIVGPLGWVIAVVEAGSLELNVKVLIKMP